MSKHLVRANTYFVCVCVCVCVCACERARVYNVLIEIILIFLGYHETDGAGTSETLISTKLRTTYS